MIIKEALKKGYYILKNENIDTYILDTKLLLCKVLNKDKMFLFLNNEKEIGKKEEEKFFKYIELRRKRMPVKYIINKCEFMGLEFYVKKGVLIPRGDTEILVEWGIDIIKKNNLREVCDLCCGSGAIGLSTACYAQSSNVSLYDISNDAIQVTKKNIKGLKLNNANVYESDLLELPIKEGKKFDVLLSNPPYVEKKEIEKLMVDVKDYEPYIALCGGEDGLLFYRKIIEQCHKVLKKGAYIGFEIGCNQGKEVSDLLEEKGFKNVEIKKDLSRLDRVVTAIYC